MKRRLTKISRPVSLPLKEVKTLVTPTEAFSSSHLQTTPSKDTNDVTGPAAVHFLIKRPSLTVTVACTE